MTFKLRGTHPSYHRFPLVMIYVAAALSGCSRGKDPKNLRDAAANGDTAECIKLIREGLSVDSPDSMGRTPLDLAVANQRLATVKALIGMSADVNHADKEGATPLIYTSIEMNFKRYPPSTMSLRNQIAQLLIHNGADTNRAVLHGDTALHFAVGDRNPTLVRMLLAAGADPLKRTVQGLTALDIAESPAYGDSEVISALRHDPSHDAAEKSK